MSVLFIALPIAVLLGVAAVIACVRCISAGQYDDLETPAVRMLIDDRPVRDSAAVKSTEDLGTETEVKEI
jgi:cbb3-type cytochrome oxidase maturation protein